MFVIVAEFRIAPDKIDAFAELIDRQAKNSVTIEQGCHYFDVCQEEGDPALFLLYELYTDAAAFAAHREYPHYKTFQAAIAAMVVDRKVRRFNKRAAVS